MFAYVCPSNYLGSNRISPMITVKMEVLMRNSLCNCCVKKNPRSDSFTITCILDNSVFTEQYMAWYSLKRSGCWIEWCCLVCIWPWYHGQSRCRTYTQWLQPRWPCHLFSSVTNIRCTACGGSSCTAPCDFWVAWWVQWVPNTPWNALTPEIHLRSKRTYKNIYVTYAHNSLTQYFYLWTPPDFVYVLFMEIWKNCHIKGGLTIIDVS